MSPTSFEGHTHFHHSYYVICNANVVYSSTLLQIFSFHCFTNCLINQDFTVLHFKRCLHFVLPYSIHSFRHLSSAKQYSSGTGSIRTERSPRETKKLVYFPSKESSLAAVRSKVSSLAAVRSKESSLAAVRFLHLSKSCVSKVFKRPAMHSGSYVRLGVLHAMKFSPFQRSPNDKKKSAGVRSGEYGGWLISTTRR